MCLKRGKMRKIENLHLCTSCFDRVTKLMKTKPSSIPRVNNRKDVILQSLLESMTCEEHN